MNPITYFSAEDVSGALAHLYAGVDANAGPSKVIAGGTNLLDLMKERVMGPQQLVDINALPLDQITPTDRKSTRLNSSHWE